MKKLNLLLLGLGLFLILLSSCEPEISCEDISCVNGVTSETETGCECDCTGTFYTGTDCSAPDPGQVQALLDNGITPLSLLNNGVSIENFYGVSYEGGQIFYLSADGTGLVAANTNIDVGNWGCRGTITGANGRALGTGAQNTMNIVTWCSESGNAAKLCADYIRNDKGDWFLPSRDELNLMYTNLHAKDYGQYSNDFYYSSTEADSYNAWFQDFNDGSQFNASKSSFRLVRAVRAF